MPTPVETLLTTIGLAADDIPKITTVPDDQVDKFDAKPFVEKVKANFTKQIANDPAFFNDLTIEKLPPEVVKKIEGAQFQRSANIMKGKLNKVFGLTDADLADLTDDEKEKLELYVTAVANKFAKTKAGDKQMQQEIIELRKKLEANDGLEEKLKTKFQTESDQKTNAGIFNAVMLAELASIPGLKIAPSDIAGTAKDLLLQKYAFERVGDYAIELRQKSNPTLKVLKENSSEELSLKDALTEIATKRSWIAEEKDDDEDSKTGSGKVKVVPKSGKLSMVAPHLQDKIGKKIAAEQ